MAGIAGVNCQAELTHLVPAGMPVLAVLHDDEADPLKAYAGMNVVLWRCMSPRSQAYKLLPQGAHVVGANENEEDWTTWYAAWVAEVRANRPDLKVHHPPANTQGQFPYDPQLAALCDVIDVHGGIGRADDGSISYFDGLGGIVPDKPRWLTEAEVDPAAPDLMTAIPQAMAHWLASGYEAAFAWGIDPSVPDVLNHPDVLAAIAALTPTGGTTVAGTIEDRVTALEQRDADITKALNLILKGEYTGADGAAGQVVALQGGTDDLTGNVKVPTFP